MTEQDGLQRVVKRLRAALCAVGAVALLPWIGAALVALGAIPLPDWRASLPRMLDLPCEIRARGFRVYDANGRELVFVGRGKGGGNLTLRDDDGEQILVAGDFDGHGGYLEVGSGKSISAHLGAGATARGFLLLRDEEGHDLVYAGHDDDGDGLVQVHRQGGDLGALLIAGPNGGELDLFDAQKRKFLYAGPTRAGSGFVKVLDDDGSLLAVFGATGSEPRSGFFKALSADEKGLFYAGGDQRDGHGLLNVCSKEGQMIVAIGIDGGEQGGVLNVFDLAGTMVLREPDWK